MTALKCRRENRSSLQKGKINNFYKLLRQKTPGIEFVRMDIVGIRN